MLRCPAKSSDSHSSRSLGDRYVPDKSTDSSINVAHLLSLDFAQVFVANSFDESGSEQGGRDKSVTNILFVRQCLYFGDSVAHRLRCYKRATGCRKEFVVE